MQRAGFELPCNLIHEAIPVLRGMAAGYGSEDNFYEHLIDIINEHGAIYLWAEQ